MKAAAVPFSRLVETGRWDVAFHFACERIKERVLELKKTMTAEQCIDRISKVLDGGGIVEGFRTGFEKRLQEIARGQYFRSGRFMSTVKEYPYESYALLEEATTEMEAVLERAEEAVRTVRSLLPKREEA